MTNAEIARKSGDKCAREFHGGTICESCFRAALDWQKRELTAALDAKDDAHAEIEKLKTTRSLQAQEIKRLTPIRESALCHSFVAFHDCTHTHEALKQQLADAKRTTWEKVWSIWMRYRSDSAFEESLRRTMEEDCK
jgi:hypothetical protein